MSDIHVLLGALRTVQLHGLCGLCAMAGFTVVDAVRDQAALLAAAGQHTADVVLCETRVLGAQPCAALVALAGRRVLLLGDGARGDDVQLLMAGAIGFLAPDCELEDFRDAVRRAAAGDFVLDARMQNVLARRVRQADPPLLTAREQTVLEHVARGLGDEDIARAMHLSPSTVKKHVHSATGKLGATNRTGAACEAIRRGLVA